MVETSKVKVLVCCHKKDVMATQEPYFPIQVGKDINNCELNIQGDNTGENISSKNQSYCELTGLYWAWKNLKGIDVIGLCHYRRYFDFHNQCRLFVPYDNFRTEQFETTDLSIPDSIIQDVLTGGKVVVSKPLYYNCSLAVNYCVAHVSDDLRILHKVITETQPQAIVDAFNVVMFQRNTLIPCNMFLMNWNDFDSYCNWLFPLLHEVEKHTDITNYNPIQKRIYGYMAERLFNVWLYAKHKTLIYKPVIKFCDNFETTNALNYITHRIKSKMYNLLECSSLWDN